MKSFRELAAERVVIFDGAMGTAIQKLNLSESVWQSSEGNNEILNITAPEVITNIHRQYYAAGADVAVTNTFGANRIVLAEYGLSHKVAAINAAAVKNACAARSGPNNKYVALSVGPGSRLPTLGQITYNELYASYYEQIFVGAAGGADIIIVETCQDLMQIKSAINAAIAVNAFLGKDLPVIASFTVEENTSLLAGSDISCISTVLGGCDIYALGINCGFGPDKIHPAYEELARQWNGRLYLSPNAGMPIMSNGKLAYPTSPADFSKDCAALAEEFNINIAGGCCGTGYEHIAALQEALSGAKSGRKSVYRKTKAGFVASAYASVPLRQIPAPAVVGERANATGSKLFRDKLKERDYSAMAELARNQESSAHIIDLSVSLSGHDELGDMLKAVSMLNSELMVPLMVDSVSVDVIEAALKSLTGKPVINSVNFEDGGEKLHQVFSLLKNYPAAVVALTIDEAGMARSVEDKLSIGRRIYKTWTEKYHMPPEDLIIDFLTFPVTTGDEDSRYAAVNTLEAIREFVREYPAVNTLLGVSNVSFGLSPKSRIILNAVFLHQAVQAGLSMAILHAEKLLPYHEIPAKELKLAEDLLAGLEGALDNYITHFAIESTEEEGVSEDISASEKLRIKVLRAESSDLESLINTLLKDMDAAAVLTDILMSAMDEVGKLFGEGKLLLPFVLKSAEVMRKCADILSPYLKDGAGAKRGKLVLATVYGDVHDIGKNLVDIIFTGNGYDVINMGTKIPGVDIVKTALESKADAIGMSGLLVKSVEIMKANIELISKAGLDVKVLLGGAALSREYVDKECSPIMPGKVFYCKDAFSGLMAMQGEQVEEVVHEKSVKNIRTWDIEPFNGEVVPPFTQRSDVEYAAIDEIVPFLRKKALFEGKWGHRKNDGTEPEKDLGRMLGEINKSKISPRFVYGYYPAEVAGNDVFIYAPEKILFALFPRRAQGECLADLYKTESGKTVVPLQFVTMGPEVDKFLETQLVQNAYSEYYKYHGLFAELTEAFAGYVQSIIYEGLQLKENGQSGKKAEKLLRYSFGYPMCPDLSGNKIMYDVMKADELDVSVSETFQMEPVYSTCAFLSWHPQSKYTA